MDCYTDPLGWKDGLLGCGRSTSLSHEASNIASTCKNVKDVNKLLSTIIELGQGTIDLCLFSCRMMNYIFDNRMPVLPSKHY